MATPARRDPVDLGVEGVIAEVDVNHDGRLSREAWRTKGGQPSQGASPAEA